MLLFAEHFDGYASDTEFGLLKESTLPSRTEFRYDPTGGVWGGGCIQADTAAAGGIFPLLASPAANLVRFAFWFKTNDAGSATGTRPIFALINATNSLGWFFFNSGTAGASKLGFCLFDDDMTPSISSTSAATIGDGTWHHIEVAMAAHTSAGALAIWIDGVLDGASIGSGDTSNAASGDCTVFTHVKIAGCSNNSGTSDINIDDVIVWDDSGTGFTGQLTDLHRLRALPAEGNGTVNDFTPSTGSNYQNVDDAVSDGDTTYNESDTVGDEDRYDLAGSLGFSPAVIYAVLVENNVRREGIRAINSRNLIDLAGTTDYGDVRAVRAGFNNLQSVHELAPDAAAWTEAKLNACEFGVEYNS